jgi:hypothetical protein
MIDMGMQPMDDAAMVFTGTPEMEAEELAKNPLTYFENMIDNGDGKKEKRYKRWPVKNTQTVGLTVDFPDIMIDKGQFFGDESGELKPLRMIMGGQFMQKYSTTYPLNVRKNDKTNNVWSMPHNSMLYKMGADSGEVVRGNPFLPEQIDTLLKKAFQFNVMIGMKGEFLKESIKYMGPLGRGMLTPVLDDKYVYMVQFDGDNTDEALKQLTNAAVNTMKQSPDWADSKVAAQYAKFKGEAAPAVPEQGALEVNEPQRASNQPVPTMTTRGRNEPEIDMDDEDLPF